MVTAPVRVLVVDDSIVTRQIISDALSSDPSIQVVGFAANGRLALEQIERLKPDVVTLDLEMPEMEGLAALDALRYWATRPAVVVFSASTARGADATLEALSRGASDYVCKPSGQRNFGATVERIRVELLPKIHALGSRTARASLRARAQRTLSLQPAVQSASLPVGPPAIIVIGVSTGGPAALAEVIPKLPSTLRQPVLIVQHMPPIFTRALADRLSALGPLRVREAINRQRLEYGTVLVAPGDHHMRIAGQQGGAWITLDQSTPENGCRPAVDPLFRSAAHVFGERVLALVLTGLGSDGTHGARAIRAAGGQVWAQDEESAVVWGMPGSVVSAGLCHRVLPLHEIGTAIGDAARGFVPYTSLPAGPGNG